MRNKENNTSVSRRRFILSTVAATGAISLPSQLIANNEKDGKSLTETIFNDDSIPYIGMTEDGPLYPPEGIPWLNDLTDVTKSGKRAKGETLYLFGRILDKKGTPLPNASVEIWQTDFNGNYKHPRGWGQNKLDPNFGYFGKVRTNSEGFYLFKTIRPRWYSLFGFPRAAHIHLKMRHKDHGVLTTETYFENTSHEEIAPKDQVFLSRSKWVRDRIVLPEDSPDQFRSLGIEFEKGSICCQYDLAFIL